MGILNCSSSNIIDWQFSRFSRFSTNGISLHSEEAEMKKLRRSGQAHFLGASSPDSFPPDRFALHRSHVWLKCEPACRLLRAWNRAAKRLDEKVSLLLSLQIFYFHPGNRRKEKSINFTGSMTFGILDFSGKLQIFFISTCRCDIRCW